VVLLLPVTGAHRVLARLESLAAAAGRVVGAAVGRAWHAAITRPLLGLLGAARVPLRWLGQAARRLLAAPLRVLAAASTWLSRGGHAVLHAVAAALRTAGRPAVWLAERAVATPARWLAGLAGRLWLAAERLGAAVWGVVATPFRWAGRGLRSAWQVTASPFRASARLMSRARARLAARYARLLRR